MRLNLKKKAYTYREARLAQVFTSSQIAVVGRFILIIWKKKEEEEAVRKLQFICLNSQIYLQVTAHLRPHVQTNNYY